MTPTVRTIPNARRGGIYIAVLATATIVTVIGLASMAAWRVQAATANAAVDAAEAKLYAEAGVEEAAYYLSSDPSWRTNRAQGAWWSNLPFGRGTLTLSGADPVDANFANRPYDPLDLTCTGRKGAAVHMTTVRLQPQGTPIAALAMAMHTAGQIRVNSGTLTVTGAPLSTNGNIRLDGAVAGSVQCSTRSGSGSASGGVTLLSASKPMPPSGIISMYQGLATTISPGSTMNKQVLAPGVNTVGGGANAEGVYYISAPAGMTISNCRVNGTLIINCPNQTVTISGTVLFQPARPDYPALIVNGKLNIQTTGAPLSEAGQATNYNPTGAPYQSVADGDQLDSYPGEIQGLVHCTDQLNIINASIIRGAVICESTDGTQAIYSDGTPQVIYDPSLYSSPPMGYTTAVTLKLAPGSWRQTVLP